MRTILFLLPLWIMGCGSETELSNGLPDWPDSNAPPAPILTQTDVIVQVTTPRVDVLWVIDDSCSMQQEQDDLIENFPLFMGYFLGSGLDYHVGVTSTDADVLAEGGRLVEVAGTKFISESTPNATEMFSSMAGLGTGGSGTERGLEVTFHAIETHRDGFNKGFYRDEAAIHTIVITDEDDQSRQMVIGSNDEFVGWYRGLKIEVPDRTFSGIVSPPGPFTYSGDAYRYVSGAIGGGLWDIRDDNWEEVLDHLGVQAAGLKREYFLSQQPIPETIYVEVRDGPVVVTFPPGDWTYSESRNSITFTEYVPQSLSKVSITYDLLATANGIEDLL